MAPQDLTGAKVALGYLLKHFHLYDSVIILSYTPSLLLREEQEVEIKRRYADALLKRCRSGKGKTTIYVAESGIKARARRGSIRSNLEIWDELISIAKKNPQKLQIKVIKDENLPCVSFIIAHVPPEPWGTRAPYDLLVEYRIGMKPDQLFATEKEDGEKSQYEYHVSNSGDLPAGIKWILEYLEILCPAMDLEKWIDDSRIRSAPAPPELAVISAMPIEVQCYRKGLSSKSLVNGEKGNQHGQFVAKKRSHEVIYPPTGFGRYKTFETIASIHREFPSIKKLFFVGVAGGSPKKTNVGDVVISTEIVELLYERAILKNEAKSMHGVQVKGKVVDLSPDIKLELRTEPYSVNADLARSINGLADKIDQDRWEELVKKYLGYCKPSPQKKKLLSELPKIVPGKTWSSDHNINDSNFRDKLTEEFGVIAFEMEGGGFAAGAKAFDKEFVEVRGISDMSDGQRGDDSILQSLALAVASAGLEALLQDIL